MWTLELTWDVFQYWLSGLEEIDDALLPQPRAYFLFTAGDSQAISSLPCVDGLTMGSVSNSKDKWCH